MATLEGLELATKLVRNRCLQGSVFVILKGIKKVLQKAAYEESSKAKPNVMVEEVEAQLIHYRKQETLLEGPLLYRYLCPTN